MAFVRVLGRYLNWFHILGLTTFSPSDARNTALSAINRFEGARNNVKKYISTGVMFTLLVLVSVVLCMYSNFVGKYSHSSGFSKIIISLVAVMLLFTALNGFVAMGQAYFLSAYYEQLCAQIEGIEALMHKRVTWNLNTFRRSMSRQMCVLVIVYFQPYIGMFCTKSHTTSNLVIMSCDIALSALKQITFFYVLFFIQLLNHMQQSLVKHIGSRATKLRPMDVSTINSRDVRLTALRFEMYYFKLLHFNLWEFAQTINQLFGWILFIFLVHQFIYAVYIFFHMCIMFLEPSNDNEVMRKSESGKIAGVDYN